MSWVAEQYNLPNKTSHWLVYVNAERFISLIIREPFNYTNWQKNLFKGMTIEEISDDAMKLYNETY